MNHARIVRRAHGGDHGKEEVDRLLEREAAPPGDELGQVVAPEQLHREIRGLSFRSQR